MDPVYFGREELRQAHESCRIPDPPLPVGLEIGPIDGRDRKQLPELQLRPVQGRREEPLQHRRTAAWEPQHDDRLGDRDLEHVGVALEVVDRAQTGLEASYEKSPQDGIAQTGVPAGGFRDDPVQSSQVPVITGVHESRAAPGGPDDRVPVEPRQRQPDGA